MNYLSNFINLFSSFPMYFSSSGCQCVTVNADDGSGFSHYLMCGNDKYGLIDEMFENAIKTWSIMGLIILIVTAVMSFIGYGSCQKQRGLAISLDLVMKEKALQDKRIADLMHECSQLKQQSVEVNLRFKQKESESNQEIAGLRESCELLKQDKLQLTNMMTQMEGELHQEKHNRTQFEGQLTTMGLNFSQQNLVIQELNNDIHKLQEENKLLNNEVEHKIYEIRTLKEEISKKNAQENRIMEDMNKRNEEYTQLQHTVCKMESTIEKLNRQLDNVKRDCYRLDEALVSKNSENEKLNRNNQLLQVHLNDLQAEMQELIKRTKELTEDNRNMKKVLDDKETKLVEKMNDLDDTKRQMVSREHEINVQRDKLKETIFEMEQLHTVIFKYKEDLKNLKTQLSTSHKKGEALECEIEKLKRELDIHIRFKDGLLQKICHLEQNLHYR